MKKVTKLLLSSMCLLSLPLYSSDSNRTENGDTQRVQVDRTERCSSCGKPRPTKDGSSDSVATPSAEKCGCHKPRPPRKAADNDRVERCSSCGKPRPTKDGSSDSVATPSAEKCGCHKPRPPRKERCNACGKPKPTKDISANLPASIDSAEKCGCGKPRPPRVNESQRISHANQCSFCERAKSNVQAITQECNDSRTIELSEDVTVDMVDACCEYCEQPGSLGCQGENSNRCRVCQQGKIKQSIKEAAAAAMVLSKQ